jgi:hypothetical protein
MEDDTTEDAAALGVDDGGAEEGHGARASSAFLFSSRSSLLSRTASRHQARRLPDNANSQPPKMPNSPFPTRRMAINAEVTAGKNKIEI